MVKTMDLFKNWVEREVELALDRLQREKDHLYLNYASDVYKQLSSDIHDRTDLLQTIKYLNRLIDHKPLTPITDLEDEWLRIVSKKDGGATYQSKRLFSLFRDVSKDGKTTYSDVERFHCVNIHDRTNKYHSGLVDRILDELFPITIPYMPSMIPYTVYCDENDDTMGVLYAVTPLGDKFEVNRFFKKGPALHGSSWTEISEEEYHQIKLTYREYNK